MKNLSEYGLMMPKYCEKYQLDKDQETSYYGIDGSLLVTNRETKLIYSNENYCVDFFYYRDAKDPLVDIIEVSLALSFYI